VHNNCIDRNAVQNRDNVVEHHISTDRDTESQFEYKINHDGFNPIRKGSLHFYFLPCAEREKMLFWQ
jgi:hypothetical protein